MVKVTFLDVKTAFSDLGGEAAVLLCGENGFEQTSCYKKLNELSGDALARAVKMQEFTGEKGASLFLLAPAAQLGAALLVGVGGKDKKDPSDLEMEEAGGAAFAALKKHFGKKIPKKVLFVLPGPFAGKAARAALGVELASYFFNRHKGTGAKTEERNPVAPEWVFALPGAEDAEKAGQAWKNLAGLGQGVKLARDLVSEPANHLFPAEFVKRIEALRGQGLDVEVLDRAAMKKLGFGALLGVAQGSEQPPYAVVMRYRGAEGAPLAFVGKGVTFDSGGISIKPSAGMDEMKTDMGGAAAVTGLMSALAAQKMPVNAVGIVGLVENMPSGTAQRPGDIVTSHSGQTIEVLNTDAEGRLVLADLLSYIVKQENPRAVIDLATLTGAILIALGDKYAGLFSNEDTLAEALQKAGQETGEKLWRLPLGEEYDRMLDSPVADIKNISEGRLAGSITAAQFLRRFVGETPWAHLDIAGVAYKGKGTDLAPRGATGFGVRLLNDFVQNFR